MIEHLFPKWNINKNPSLLETRKAKDYHFGMYFSIFLILQLEIHGHGEGYVSWQKSLLPTRVGFMFTLRLIRLYTWMHNLRPLSIGGNLILKKKKKLHCYLLRKLHQLSKCLVKNFIYLPNMHVHVHNVLCKFRLDPQIAIILLDREYIFLFINIRKIEITFEKFVPRADIKNYFLKSESGKRNKIVVDMGQIYSFLLFHWKTTSENFDETLNAFIVFEHLCSLTWKFKIPLRTWIVWSKWAHV